MKDSTLRVLSSGDYVTYIRPYYHDLKLGRVNSFTPKMVRVEGVETDVMKLDSGEEIIRIVERPNRRSKVTTTPVHPQNLTIINEVVENWPVIQDLSTEDSNF